ncbi:MAG: hypothetical protein L6R39_005976 [Caloplaca ligustica]|nr:MAG: hypothetical protein L6R39_005976 [Caloplaca ligustica]
MDVLTRWFQFKLGVEPNKATLQGVAQGFNDYGNFTVQALAQGQKALEQYASDAKPQQFLSSTPLGPEEKQKLIEQYVSSPEGKQELEKRLKKQEKAQRQPIIWQIPEEKFHELQWQRTQLLRMQAAQRAKQNPNAAKKPIPKVSTAGAKRVGPTRQPPKLGKPKSATASKASSVAGGGAKPTQAANQAQKNVPNGVPAKAPGKTSGQAPGKAAPKMNGVAK